MDSVPEAMNVFHRGKNGQHEFEMLNQGLIFMSGLRKLVDFCDSPNDLRKYAVKLNAKHHKRFSIKPNQMCQFLQAFEPVLLECVQNEFRHSNMRKTSSRRQSLLSNPSRRGSIVAEQAEVLLLGPEHFETCDICQAWSHFFKVLYYTFDPNYSEEGL